MLAAVIFAAPHLVDGVWRSQGYGNVYEIQGMTLRAFEVTAQTCVPAFKAKRIMTAISDREATFEVRRGDVASIGAGRDNDHKLLKHPDSLYGIRIERIARRPAACDAPIANTPLTNFDVFTRTFSENYIAFDSRHIDWDRMVAENRRKLTAQTKPAQLFDLLDSMLKPLGDLHTGIGARSLKRESEGVFRAGTDRVIKEGIDRFAGKGRASLFAATDRAWIHGPLRALVIDVRLSFGGDDKLGLAIASRLTNVSYLAYSIQARSDPMVRDKWTVADRVFVEPSSRIRFAGPVVELIGPITMSAAETFSQALMGRSPHVTRIGENTQGVFCDPLFRRLPNGWDFSLPNAVYRTAEGIAFDVEGIPPDVKEAVFSDDDVAGGRDPAMALAAETLSLALPSRSARP